MHDDAKPRDDAMLSDAEVNRVLERAVRIDGGRAVSVSELTQVAREAGISEAAIVQAVREVLDDRRWATTAAHVTSAPAEVRVRQPVWLRAVALGSSLVITLVVISFMIRLLFP